MDEFGLIDTFVAQFDVAPSPQGPGDDCAVIPKQGPSCVTTDAVVEGVHFTRQTFSLEDVGHKALAVNLSDVAAMGARPSWFTVALGLPDDVGARELKKIGAGMSALARTHGAKLVGGNVTRAAQLSLTLTVSGLLDGPAMLRSGGRPGDALYLSGPVGEAAAALPRPAKRGEGRGEGQRNQAIPAIAALERAQRRPAPHVAFGLLARRLCTAAIDVSDGLAQDLGHLCDSSKVGAELSSSLIPLTDALLTYAGSHKAALRLGLTGGEDYVLLVAVRQVAAFEAAMARAGFEAYPIGWLTAGSGLCLDGKTIKGPLGFKHR